MSLPVCVQNLGNGKWRLNVWVQPRARRQESAGMYRDSLKIRLVSPPVDDKANRELLDFVAQRLGLRPKQVSIESGHSSRGKTVVIESAGQPCWQALFPAT